MRDRNGCIVGILQLLALTWLFDWLQDTFGFGKGCSCIGCGCGIILLIIFLTLACSIIFGTNWMKLVIDSAISIM